MPDSFKKPPQDEALRTAVEAALKRGAPLLRLPPALEERYEAATWRGRCRGIRNWMLVIAVLGLFWIFIDWTVMPEHMLASFVVRGLLMPTIYLGAVAILMRQRPAWVQGMAVLVPTVSLALVTGYLADFAGGVHAERYNTAALFASFTMTMVLAIPFRFAAVQAVLAILIFEYFQLGNLGAIAENIEVALFYPASILAALAARRRFELMHRRNFLLALRDELRVDDLANANDRLTTLSNTDGLTGVFNRRHFDRAFAAGWRNAVEHQEHIAVVMVDVDHFKMFNDAAGHAEGDRCLQLVATAIEEQVRGGSDLVARYGGEEFIVLLPGADLDGALATAERVRAAVERLDLVNPGHPAGKLVTVSVGVAAVRAAVALAPANLLRAADTALYAAKATGRNYVCGASGTGDHMQSETYALRSADDVHVPLVPEHDEDGVTSPYPRAAASGR